MPSLLELAQQMYPRLPKDIGYKESFGHGQGPGLEFYRPEERDNPFPGKAAVEVFNSRTKPEDVAADIASHHMIDSDPVVAQAYRTFLMSLKPWQQKILQNQYVHAQKNFGEARPFAQWAEMTGQPGYFRGYAFGQWPEDFNKRAYTPDQRKLLDDVVKYLLGGE